MLWNDRAIVSPYVIEEPSRSVGDGSGRREVLQGGVDDIDDAQHLLKSELKTAFIELQKTSEIQSRLHRPEHSRDVAISVQSISLQIPCRVSQRVLAMGESAHTADGGCWLAIVDEGYADLHPLLRAFMPGGCRCIFPTALCCFTATVVASQRRALHRSNTDASSWPTVRLCAQQLQSQHIDVYILRHSPSPGNGGPVSLVKWRDRV